MSVGNINYEHYSKLFDDTPNVNEKLQIATEIRDNMEGFQTTEYKLFLHYFFPIIYNKLRTSPPQFEDNKEHQIRNVLLEIIAKLPMNELLQQNVQNLLKLCMYLLETDNEENALICLRIIMDIHKNYKNKIPALENEVQPFLEIVLRIYDALPKALAHAFRVPQPVTQAPTQGNDFPKPNPCIHSIHSLKVLSECPILMVVLFQLYASVQQKGAQMFIPYILNTLNLQPPPNARAINKVAFQDFILVQVKTLTFLAFLVRGNFEQFKQFQESIPTAVVQILMNCPSEPPSTRKELLIGIRHMLVTEFRLGFIKHVDTLLEEKVLLGSSKTSLDVTRPLAYSALADLFHHVRTELTLPQLLKIVNIYSRNLHDSALPFQIQTVSAKLLLNLVEPITKKTDPEFKGRAVLLRILDAFVNKFSSLKKQIPKLLSSKQGKNEKGTENIRECRALLKTLVVGLKNIVWGMSMFRAQAQAQLAASAAAQQANPTGSASNLAALNPQAQVFRVTVEESLMFTGLLKNGLKCFSIYYANPNVAAFTTENQSPAPPSDNNNAPTESSVPASNQPSQPPPIPINYPVPTQTEERDLVTMLDTFAGVFTFVDPRIFQDVFTLHLKYLFDRIIENQVILAIPQHFLANQTVTRIFTDILLNFLMDKMKVLGGTDKVASNIILRLFKLVFGSVTVFAENELVIQPYLPHVITSVMKYAVEVKESMNYFILLRAVFRSVSAGKFDFFFKEFLPLLPSLLEGLNRMQQSSHSPQMRDIFVELSLTVPVRLSSLLPCLGLIMRPLVLALEASGDLVQQGLRSLETCVDNLTPEYLNPILADVKQDLMQALWKHLRPAPYACGVQALRILGKLAGRNRDFLNIPAKLKMDKTGFEFDSSSVLNGSLVIPILIENTKIDVSLDKTVYFAKQKLLTSIDTEAKKHAFLYLRMCLSTVLVVFNASKPNPPRSLKIGSYLRLSNEASTKLLISTDPSYQLIVNSEQKDFEAALFKTTKMLLDSVIIASAVDKLQEIVGTLLEDVCTYFAIIFFQRRGSELKPTVETGYIALNRYVFLEAIVDALCSENRHLAKPALKALEHIIDTTTALMGSIEDASRLEEYDELAKRLSHGCHKYEWHSKSGACMAIKFLIDKMPISWVRKHQVLFATALLFILKDLLPEISIQTLEDAAETLTLLFKKSATEFNPNNAKPEEHQYFNDVVALLTGELSSPNATVRSNVQKSLQLLSDLTTIPITQLLEPFKSTLLSPIFAKPLTKLPSVVQTGYIDALTFCLNLRPALLSVTPELLKLLQAGLIIAEKDDVPPDKSVPQKNLQAYNNLRMVCIELLSASIICPELQGPEHVELRNRIIGVFFKALTLRWPDIVNVAKKGLSQVITQGKLPKDLLQNSLRPVLVNLADYRKLSVPLLQGLARLLELLTNCFNITLGEKLLEHLNKWTEPSKTGVHKLWKDGEDIKIASSIIEIFHLLPTAANKFLEPLVLITIQLENLLTREISSPYRVPLVKFLNRYPTEATEYFLQRMSQPACSKLFRFIVREEIAAPLREELAKNPLKIIHAAFKPPVQPPQTQPNQPVSQSAPFEVQFQGVVLVRNLVKFIPDWLSQPQNKGVLDCLIELWVTPQRANRLSSEELLPLHHSRESKLLVKCFLNYCNHNKNDLDLVFYMLSIFSVRNITDYTFLKDFYQRDIAENYTQQEKKNILLKFFQYFKDNNVPQDHKVQAIRMLIIPMLQVAFTKGEYSQIFDQQTVANLINILEPKDQPYEDSVNIELLQLAALFLKFVGNDVDEPSRKELIRFAWGHLTKTEDTSIRHHAYLLVARFIEYFETPPKIIQSVYSSLLKSYQSESRTLVKQALDILLPNLPKRLEQAEQSKGVPSWVKTTKKVIIEEGHVFVQLVHVIEVIVRHPDLFYKWRSFFVVSMVNSLSKMVASNSSFDMKKLAVEMVELIVNWEKKRIRLQKETTDVMEIEGKKPEAPTPMETDVDKRAAEYKVNVTCAEMIINFLIRITNPPDPNTAASDTSFAALSTRAVELLKEAFTLWPEAHIRYLLLDKLLTQVEQPNVVSTTVSILTMIMDFQPTKFMIDQKNIDTVQVALAPVLTSNKQPVVSALGTLITKVIKTFPFTPDCKIPAFYRDVGDLMEANLNNADKVSPLLTLNLLKAISEEAPDFSERFLPSLVKLAQKLSKDHVSPVREPTNTSVQAAGGQGQQPQTQMPDPNVHPEQYRMQLQQQQSNAKKNARETGLVFLTAVNLLSSRITKLGEHKKGLFLAVTNCIEKSTEIDVLTDVTKIVTGWIREQPANSVLTTKDKIGFLTKMVRFDQQASMPLNLLYLDLVYQEYQEHFKYYGFAKQSDNNSMSIEGQQNIGSPAPNPAIPPSVLNKAEIAQLEIGFLMGLRSKDPQVRGNFFELWNQCVEPSLSARVNHIFTTQNWEPMGPLFWLKQAMDLMLCLATKDQPIHLSYMPSSAKTSIPHDAAVAINTNANPSPQTSTLTTFTGVLNAASPSVLERHEKFMTGLEALKVGDLVSSLRDLLHSDVLPDLSYFLWSNVWTGLWKTISPLSEEKVKFTAMLSNFLAREYHIKQQRSQPNVIQAILDAVYTCNLDLKNCAPALDLDLDLPIELLKYLGKTFNSWHSAVGLMETQILKNKPPVVVSGAELAMQETPTPMNIDGETPEGQTNQPINITMDNWSDLCLAELYHLLSEDDYFYAVWKRRAVLDDTKIALILEQHGMWQRAQEVYLSIMNRASSGNLPSKSLTAQPLPGTVPYSEVCLWEEHWINCAKRLSQWELLNEYAKTTHNGFNDLLLESSWKVSDWTAMKEALGKGIIPESYQLKIYQCYAAIHEGKPGDFETLHNQAIQYALKHHQTLPEIPSVAHVPLLQSFQKIVELKESAQILKDLNQNKQNCIPDLKNTLNTWRSRLPATWDDILAWNDILLWRQQHVFSMINAAFATLTDVNPSAVYMGHHETAWSVNKFSHIARKHLLVEVCLNSLSKIYTLPNIEILDAFIKLREQIKCYFQLPTHYRTGVDIINSTNLDYFAPAQKAEFFEWKGEFLAKMGMNEDAHSAFSTAVTIFDNLSSGWLSWGLFCDHQFECAEKEKDKEKELTWAEYALNCYLQAIRCGRTKERRLVARVLTLLTLDDDNERLGKVFEKQIDTLPLWIWIQWIPQLLGSLSRSEAYQAKLILMKLSSQYPQALYNPLRSFLMEKRDQHSVTFPTSSMATEPSPMELESTPQPLIKSPSTGALPVGPSVPQGAAPNQPGQSVLLPTNQPATGANPAAQAQPGQAQASSAIQFPSPIRAKQSGLKNAEEVMACLKTIQPGIVADMESMVKEISNCFQPEPEEMLHCVLKHILMQCYKIQKGNDTPDHVRDMIETVTHFNFFSGPSLSLAANKKHNEFSADHKLAIEADFASSQIGKLDILISKLNSWIAKMELLVSRLPHKLYLEDISPALSELQNSNVEIPGQYFQDSEPSHDRVKIERMLHEVYAVSMNGSTTYRVLQMRGGNGKVYSFCIQTTPILHGLMEEDRSEERVFQLLRLFSNFINKHKETRKRNVNLSIPAVIPISNRIRLIQMDRDFIPLDAIYADHLRSSVIYQASGAPFTRIEDSLQYYRQKLSTNPQKYTTAEGKLELYRHMCEITPENIISKYIHEMYPSPIHYFTFKKQFATQLAVHSIVGNVLGVGNRTPNNICISRTTGAMWQHKFYPEYNEDGTLRMTESVPFRLTRNIEHFLSPLTVDGVMNGVMTGVALCLTHYKDQLRHHLAVFVRDDAIAWQGPEHEAAIIKDKNEWKKKLQHIMDNNCNAVLENIKNLIPPQHDKHMFTTPLNKRITELLEAAQADTALSQMDPTWYPWY